MGDHQVVEDKEQRNSEYDLNVGKAIEVLKRQLPIVFYGSNLDFSIFAPQITVVDQRQNKMLMQKSFYTAAVKSLRMAATISSIYPSMNVRKVEYVEDCRTIQALVDVVLPDTMKVEGQAVWEGMLYFGLDRNGFIDTHIFDRKISNSAPAKPKTAPAYAWLRQQGPQWEPQLVRAATAGGVPVDASIDSSSSSSSSGESGSENALLLAEASEEHTIPSADCTGGFMFRTNLPSLAETISTTVLDFDRYLNAADAENMEDASAVAEDRNEQEQEEEEEQSETSTPPRLMIRRN